MPIALGNTTVNTLYVTTTGVVSFLNLPLDYVQWYNFCYLGLYNQKCRNKTGDPASASIYKSHCASLLAGSLCRSVPLFHDVTPMKNASKLNQLNVRKDHLGHIKLEGIFHPYWTEMIYDKTSKISIYKINNDREIPRHIRSKLPGSDIPTMFKETIIIHSEVLQLATDPNEYVSYYSIIGTTYKRTFGFAIFDDCIKMSLEYKNKQTFTAGYWTRPKQSHRYKILDSLGKTSTGNIKADVGDRFGSSANPPRLVGFALSDEKAENYHPGMVCQEWLDANGCEHGACRAQRLARRWCPSDDEHIHFDYIHINITDLPAHVKCYQPLTLNFEWDGLVPVCCYQHWGKREDFFDHIHPGLGVFVDGPGEASCTAGEHKGVPVNTVVMGHADIYVDDFYNQRQAYKACCLDQMESDQCAAFQRARPFTLNALRRVVGGWRGDVHLSTTDGLLVTFNGIGQYLLIEATRKNERTDGTVGFTAVGLFKNSTEAPRASFTKAIALQCLINGTNVNQSDLIQVGLNPDTDAVEILINRNPLTDVSRLNTSNGYRTPKGTVLRRRNEWLSVVLKCGLTLMIRRSGPGLTMNVIVDQQFANATRGLLGNYNGDQSDDLRSRDGSITLPANSTDRQSFPVLSTWRVNCSDRNENLIHIAGKSCHEMFDPSFVPQYNDEITSLTMNASMRVEIERTCGNSQACVFDYKVLNDKNAAASVRIDEQNVARLKRLEENNAPEFTDNNFTLRVTAGVPGSKDLSVYDNDVNDFPTISANTSATWIQVIELNASSIRLEWSSPPFDLPEFEIKATAQDSLNASTMRSLTIQYCQCRNNGTCNWEETKTNGTGDGVKVKLFQNVQCNCSRGWAGRYCENDENGCQGNPCVSSCTDVPISEILSNASAPDFRCAPCPSGYHGDGSRCIDNNECNVENGGCEQVCTNTPGSYKCSCNNGYIAATDNASRCQDKNECITGDATCPQYSTCMNTNGSYTCPCNVGFKAYDYLCGDNNECEATDNPCSAINNSFCYNTMGSYQCLCESGYVKNDENQCILSDLCEPENRCSQRCISNPPYSRCACVDGFTLADDKRTCVPQQNCTIEEARNCQGGTCGRLSNGSSSCNCGPGMTLKLSTNGSQICENVNECLSNMTNRCVPKGLAICVDRTPGYSCNCPDGYTLEANDLECVDNDECRLGTHKCDTSRGRCINNQGSYTCTCNAGFEAVINSSSGRTICTDLNECYLNSDDCHKDRATCTNTIGSYRCSCKPGLVGDGRTCVDVNECQNSSLNNCDVANGFCNNSVGNYTCSCKLGFDLATDGRSCIDVNECSLGSSRTGCWNDDLCRNLIGSYECLCPSDMVIEADGKTCTNNHECPTSDVCGRAKCVLVNGTTTCICPTGYEWNAATKSCLDIDECNRAGTTLCPVSKNVRCVNQNGSYTCECLKPQFQTKTPDGFCTDTNECNNATLVQESCNRRSSLPTCRDKIDGFDCVCGRGYEPLMSANGTCKNIDECTLGTARCDAKATCTDIEGGYVCQCPAGYKTSGTLCIDVNECLVNNGGCDHNCHNTEGSFTCSCRPGYVSQGQRCADINECTRGNANCSQNCFNQPGSYICTCNEGFVLNSDGRTCRSQTTCALGHGCSHLCSRVSGAPVCSCPHGYKLKSDSKTCAEINYCTTTDNKCTNSTICKPKLGSYHCECKKPGYKLSSDGYRCEDRDGAWSAWSRWSSCSRPCNGGSQYRSRTCTNPAPIGDGAGCVDRSFENRTCNTDRCKMTPEESKVAVRVSIRFNRNVGITIQLIATIIGPLFRKSAASIVTKHCNKDFVSCCKRDPGKKWRRSRPEQLLSFVDASDVRLTRDFPKFDGQILNISVYVQPKSSTDLCSDVQSQTSHRTRSKRSVDSSTVLTKEAVLKALQAHEYWETLSASIQDALRSAGIITDVSVVSAEMVEPGTKNPGPDLGPPPHVSIGAIVGGIIGALLLIAVIIAIVVIYKSFSSKDRVTDDNSSEKPTFESRAFDPVRSRENSVEMIQVDFREGRTYENLPYE